MNIIRQSVVTLARDWRSGELRLIALAVIIAVASLTSVYFFTDRVGRATELRATELLAADLVLLSPDPIPEEIIDLAQQAALTTTLTTSFRSVAVAGAKLQMAEVKAIEDGYPIRGKLRVSDTLFGDEYSVAGIPPSGTVWTDGRLLQALGIQVGDSITLGTSALVVTRVLTYEPDRGGDLFNIAPRLLMNLADLPATGLLVPGSQAQYRLLTGGDADVVTAYRRHIEDRNKGELRVQGIRDARPELRTALERAEQFLSLAALVSIALAGLAIAMSAQRYAVRHFDNCAIMRCLGAQQQAITWLYFNQLIILSLISSLIGCLAGFLAQEGLARLAAGFARGPLPLPSLSPVWTGLTAGVVTVLGFAMPQILRLRTVPPLRVFRRDLAPVPLRGISSYGFAIGALALLTPWHTGNYRLTLYVFLGILVTAAVLMLITRFIIHWLGKLRSRVGVAYRYGLANVARRKNQSIAQVIGIGIGIMVMILLTLIRTDLLENWRDRIPEGTPNYFLMNIQTDEVEGLKTYLLDNGAETSIIFPMIRGRLTRINGNDVGPDDYEDPRARGMVDRDYNLTWSKDMQTDNRLVSGEWWPPDKSKAMKLSIEQEYAQLLGLHLGDEMTFTVGGDRISGRITSTRWVEWDSFNVNFFIVANPGSLDDIPGTWITSFFLPPGTRSLMIDLVRKFPSITVIDVDAILSEVRRIMNQVIRTVEFVFGFTLLAGMVVLLAALQTTNDERSYESALLSSLGANRNQILSGLVAEFVCLGLVAGVMAALAASVLEVIIADLIFKMEIAVNPWVWLVAPLISVVVIVAGGLAGTRRVLNTPPMIVLRKV